MSNTALFQRRRSRVRNKIRRTTDKARLSVHRTNKHIYAQIIDDVQHKTIAQAYSGSKELSGLKKTWDVEAAQKVGELLAQLAKKAGVETVVFDRGGYVFHGRVKALADAARAGGLKF